MNVVYKHQLFHGLIGYGLPKGAEILSVALQFGTTPTVWFKCDPRQTEKETRRLLMTGTGHEFEDKEGKWRFVGTILEGNGLFVWHVFEQIS